MMIPAELQQVDFFRYWKIIVQSHHGRDWSLPGGSIRATFNQKMLMHKQHAYSGWMLHFEGSTWKVSGFANTSLFVLWQMGAKYERYFSSLRERHDVAFQDALPAMSLQEFTGSVQECLTDMVHIRLAL